MIKRPMTAYQQEKILAIKNSTAQPTKRTIFGVDTSAAPTTILTTRTQGMSFYTKSCKVSPRDLMQSQKQAEEFYKDIETFESVKNLPTENRFPRMAYIEHKNYDVIVKQRCQSRRLENQMKRQTFSVESKEFN